MLQYGAPEYFEVIWKKKRQKKREKKEGKKRLTLGYTLVLNISPVVIP